MSLCSLHAVILVAGRGERLRPFTERLPKSLVPVGGRPILGRMLDALRHVGVRSVVLVTGYRAERIRQFVDQDFDQMRLRMFANAIYARTNTLFSLLCARRAVEGRPFLLIDGDLVFEPAILRALVKRSGDDNFVACDRAAPLDAEAVCVEGRSDGRVLHIGKQHSHQGSSLGESIGLARISAKTSRHLFRIGREILRNRGNRYYYEAAFQALIDQGAVFRSLDVRGAKWVEIDTKSDLRRARACFNESAKRAK